MARTLKTSFSIDDIFAPRDLPAGPDLIDNLLESRLRQAELEEIIQDYASNRELREKYAAKVYLFLATWSAGVFLILVVNGFGLWGFTLADTVLSVLVGGTTISVIGLVGFIVRGLFASPRRGGSSN